MSELSIRLENHPELGKVYRLSAKTVLSAPLDSVFAFFSDASNLQKLTPPWIGFRILTHLPIEMKQDALIDYRISLHGLPIKWRTKIEVWDPPNRFVDLQLSGPYKLWHHTHSFTSCMGGTEMSDEVLYWPIGGVLANRFLVEKDVRRIFEFRDQEIQRLFASSFAQPAS